MPENVPHKNNRRLEIRWTICDNDFYVSRQPWTRKSSRTFRASVELGATSGFIARSYRNIKAKTLRPPQRHISENNQIGLSHIDQSRSLLPQQHNTQKSKLTFGDDAFSNIISFEWDYVEEYILPLIKDDLDNAELTTLFQEELENIYKFQNNISKETDLWATLKQISVSAHQLIDRISTFEITEANKKKAIREVSRRFQKLNRQVLELSGQEISEEASNPIGNLSIDDIKAHITEFWNKRDKTKGEKICDFISRVYEPWIGKGLTRAHLKVDPSLYTGLSNWLRNTDNKIPDDLHLPTAWEALPEIEVTKEELAIARKVWSLQKRLERAPKK